MKLYRFEASIESKPTVWTFNMSSIGTEYDALNEAREKVQREFPSVPRKNLKVKLVK